MANSRLSRRAVLGTGLALAATPVLGAGCAAARAAGEPLRIGVLLDTSGPAASHGKRQLLGVQHQAEVINAAAGAAVGSAVRLFIRDTQGSVDITRAHAKALLAEDNVDTLIGTSMPPTAEAVMTMAQAASVPMIVPTTISPPTQPFVFSSAATSEQTTRQTMRSLAEAAIRRAALLILDSLATPKRMEIFFREAAAHDVQLIAIAQFPVSVTNLTAPLHTLTTPAPDAILVASPPPFNAMAAHTLHTQRWPGWLYCSASAGHPAFLHQAGPAAEGVRVIAPWLLLAEHAPATLPNSWAIREFVASFTPRYGPVGTFAGYGADAVAMAHQAYAGHRDRGRARTILEHMTHVGVTGLFHMTPTSHAGLADDALTTVVIRNRTWTTEDGRP